MDVNRRQIVVQAPGLLKIVSSGSKFLPVSDSEIVAVRSVVNSPVFRTPWPYLCLGEKVVIHRGPLAGLEGILVEQKNQHRIIVSVHLLQRSVAAEVCLDWVRPFNKNFRIAFETAGEPDSKPAVRANVPRS